MKNSVKRFVVAAIATAAMMQGAAFAAIVKPTVDTVIVNTDFENGITDNNFCDGVQLDDTPEEGYGKALTTSSTDGYARYASWGATNGKSKIMVSFDFKYDSDNNSASGEIVKLRTNNTTSGTADFNLTISGGKLNPYDSRDWSELPTFNYNTWYSIDMLVDYTKSTIDVYVNGEHFSHATRPNGIAAIQNIYLKRNQPAYYDNFRLSEYTAEGTVYPEKYEYAAGDKYVKVRYSESLAADSLDLTKVKLVNTTTGADEKHGDAVLSGKTLFIPVNNFSFDTEYALCLPQETVSITGKSITNPNDYFTVETKSGDVPNIANTALNVDFEAEDNLSGFRKDKIADTGDADHGKALQITTSTTNEQAKYPTLTAATYNTTEITKKAIIKFDIKQTKDTEVSSGYKLQLVLRNVSADADENGKRTQNDTYIVITKDGKFGFPGKTAELKEGWHTVTLSFDFLNNKVTGRLDYKEFGETTIGTGGKEFYPNSFHVLARENSGIEFMLDNFQIGTFAEKAKVANVRINRGNAVYGVCDTVPILAENIKVNFTDNVLANTISGENIMLKKSNGETVSASVTAGTDGASAIITPAAELAPNTHYTVMVTGVQTTAGNNVAEYATSFMTETAEFKSTAFGLLNGDGDTATDFDSILLAENAGKVYVSAEIQNDFGTNKIASIIFAWYENGNLVDLQVNPITVPAGQVKTIGLNDDISFNVPESTEDCTLKTFIWDMNNGNIAAMFDNAVIDR